MIKRRLSLLQNKVALITGAGRGIGRGIAEVFAQAGASVVISDIQKDIGESVAKNICNKGMNASYIQCDLRKEDDIKKMMRLCVRKYGGLDIIINNARPKLQNLSFADSLGEWDLAMDVLLKAPALIAKHALPELKKSKQGNIINISSTNAFFISHQPAAYHVAKTGLIQLTKFLAYEFGSHGIRVNAVCPALVDVYDENRKPLTDNPINKKVAELVVPLRRVSVVEEIAQVALFLCTKAASYITGQILTVDGGVTLGDHFGIARKAFLEGSVSDREEKK